MSVGLILFPLLPVLILKLVKKHLGLEFLVKSSADRKSDVVNVLSIVLPFCDNNYWFHDELFLQPFSYLNIDFKLFKHCGLKISVVVDLCVLFVSPSGAL